MILDNLVISIKENEGFRGETYDDHLGNPTIGYGTLIPLTKNEATLLLRHRLQEKINTLTVKLPVFRRLPEEAQSIVAEMAYQLGVSGVLRFRMMAKALEKFEFEEAAKEMLDSKWAKVDTPYRAQKMAERMAALAANYPDPEIN